MESEDGFVFRNKNLQEKSFDIFQALREAKRFCDITFRIGNRSISAHRIIIVAGIPYFRDTLPDSSSPNEEDTSVTLPDVNPEIFEYLLEYAYKGEVTITMENVKDLLSGAYHLQVEEVRVACCDFLANRLHLQNIWIARNLASTLNYGELLANTIKFMSQHFEEISKMDEFQNLPFPQVKQLLESDDLHTSSEEEVFEAAMQWVKKCPDEREKNLPELLMLVRLPLLSKVYLKNCVATENLIRSSLRCRDLLEEARSYDYQEERDPLSNLTSQPRRAKGFIASNTFNNERMYVISAKVQYTAQYLYHLGETWKIQETKKFPKIRHCSSTALGQNIYYLDEYVLVKYDPLNDKYECLGMACSRSSAGVVALNNKLYLCGGMNGNKHLDSMECYDPESSEWVEMSCMDERRSNPGAAALGKYIYIVGGCGKYEILKSVAMYDSHTRCCKTSSSSMLVRRYALGCATLGNRIFACGGVTSGNKYTATAEVYDPSENKWKFISPMNTARADFKLLPYGGQLYALGGRDETMEYLNSVEIYDPETDTWKFGPDIDSEISVSVGEVISF